MCPTSAIRRSSTSYRELRAFGVDPIVHDPLADSDTIGRAYGIELSPLEDFREMDVLVLAVPHDDYSELKEQKLCEMLAPNGILIDVKSKFDAVALREDVQYWSL